MSRLNLPHGDVWWQQFNDFSEIVPTREITTKTEKTSFSRPWAYFLSGRAQCCSINNTHLNPALYPLNEGNYHYQAYRENYHRRPLTMPSY